MGAWIWRRSGRGSVPLVNASGRTTPQGCWKNTGRMCPGGGTSAA
nr:MAG TPA: Frog antimicrobial peptide [Caudoviricetes sp.]